MTDTTEDVAADDAPLTAIETFLFETPLYAQVDLLPTWDDVGYRMVFEAFKVDGYCPYCEQHATFSRDKPDVDSGRRFSNIDAPDSDSERFELVLTCARNDHHNIFYEIHREGRYAMKYGQLPSLATIANADAKKYRKFMSNEDAREFHTAVGLAAHGAGIASFVYLRRIFERLVLKSFLDNGAAHGISRADFDSKRMDEKIEALNGFLPPLLVEHSKAYSIMSVGLHQLTETACLAYFQPLKQAIEIILVQAKKQAEEARVQSNLKRALDTAVSEVKNLTKTPYQP